MTAVRSSGRPPTRRLAVIAVGLVVLAVLAVVAVVSSGSDDAPGDASGTTTSTATEATAAPGGPAPDGEVVLDLLPGPVAVGWVQTSASTEAEEAVLTEDDACPTGPVPDGVLVRSEQQRLVNGVIVESLSVTAGIVPEGIEPPRLDDPTVQQCLLDGLSSAVPEGAEVTAEPVDTPTAPEGAIVTVAGYQVRNGENGGVFRFMLVRRGRTVSLGLLTGFGQQGSIEVTALEDIVALLDAPLRAAEPRVS